MSPAEEDTRNTRAFMDRPRAVYVSSVFFTPARGISSSAMTGKKTISFSCSGRYSPLAARLLNLARWLKVDSESALRGTNAKFRRRFAHVEQSLREHGKALTDSNITEMEELWQQAKRGESR